MYSDILIIANNNAVIKAITNLEDAVELINSIYLFIILTNT
jgi:hypothetical protein